METPHVNPVGLLQTPEDYAASRRRASRPQRLLASALLLFFFLATVASSVLSAGAYCLTSDGGDTRALAAGVERLATPAADADR